MRDKSIFIIREAVDYMFRAELFYLTAEEKRAVQNTLDEMIERYMSKPTEEDRID